MPIFLGMTFRVIFLPQFHPLELQEVPKAWATRMNFHEPPGWLNDGTPPGGHGSEKTRGWVVSKWILTPNRPSFFGMQFG